MRKLCGFAAMAALLLATVAACSNGGADNGYGAPTANGATPGDSGGPAINPAPPAPSNPPANQGGGQ